MIWSLTDVASEWRGNLFWIVIAKPFCYVCFNEGVKATRKYGIIWKIFNKIWISKHSFKSFKCNDDECFQHFDQNIQLLRNRFFVLRHFSTRSFFLCQITIPYLAKDLSKTGKMLGLLITSICFEQLRRLIFSTLDSFIRTIQSLHHSPTESYCYIHILYFGNLVALIGKSVMKLSHKNTTNSTIFRSTLVYFPRHLDRKRR